MSASRYLSANESESARFPEVLADADPAAPVPTCPAWTALDLANHLAETQAQWAWVVGNRPKNPAERPGHTTVREMLTDACSGMRATDCGAEGG